MLSLPTKYAKDIEAITRKFIWRGKLEQLALDEIKNTREDGGLNLVCVRSKADALFLRQTCRLLATEDFNSFKHIKYWIGHFIGDIIPAMQGGPHSAIVPDLRTLFTQAHALEIINVERLNAVPCKEIYADFTSSFPTPKVIYKFKNLPWNDIWGRLYLFLR